MRYPEGQPAADRGESRDERVADAVAGYLDDLAEGRPVDPAAIVARHPELAPELEQELETLRELDLPGGQVGLPSVPDFRIVRELGRGGMGVVYEAWQASLDRRVALKLLPGSLAGDSKAVARFEREARIAARLRHSNIVQVHGTGVAAGMPYFVMELVEGKTLARAVAEMRSGKTAEEVLGALPSDVFEWAAASFADVADALQHAHSHGVIHRDLKPGNLMLDLDGRLRILDFGLARLEGQEGLTVTTDVLGTPGYMSPEQVEPRRGAVDQRTDIYSLGATLYAFLCGSPPCQGADARDSLQRVLSSDPKPLRKLNPQVPKDLETIVLKALRKMPRDRYGTAEALAQDLRRFARGDPVEARSQAALEVLTRRLWHHRAPLAAAAALGAVTITTALLLGGHIREAHRARESEYASKVTGAVLRMQLGRPVEGASPGGPAGEDRAAQDPFLEARALLEEAVTLFPDRPVGRYHLARALHGLGDVDGAIAELARAERCGAGFLPAAVLRRTLSEGEPSQDGVHEAAGTPWERSWLRAHQAVLSGRWKEAADAFGVLIDSQVPGGEAYIGVSLETFLGRGNARKMCGDLLGAHEDFVTVKARWPDAMEPDLLVAGCRYLQGHELMAEEGFEDLYRRTPFKDEAARRISLVYHGLEDHEKGLAWAERIGEPVSREIERADHLRHLKRLDQALEAAAAAVQADPRSARAHLILGSVLGSTGKLDEAEAEFRTVLALDPGDAGAHQSIALISTRRKDWRESAREYEAALKIVPRDSEAHRAYGLVLDQLAYGEQAFHEFQLAVQYNPRNGLARHSLALKLRRLGRVEEAVREYKEALRLRPAESGTHNALGSLYMDLGRQEEAIAEFTEAVRRDSRNAPAHYNLAFVFERTGKVEEAVEEATLAVELEPERRLFRIELEKVLRVLIALKGVEREGSAWGRALGKAAEVIEKVAGQDTLFLSALAAIRAARGDRRAAVLILEDAVRLPGATRQDTAALQTQREALLPDLVSYASIDAALAEPVVEALVPAGAEWRFFRGRTAPSAELEWTQPDFDDSAWEQGPSGFGYGDGDDATVLGDMQGRYTTVYARRAFQLEETAAARLVLAVKADDGFVAYVNGREAGRERAGTPGVAQPWDAKADASAPEPSGELRLAIDPAFLSPGGNVLAVQGLNSAVDSSDLSLIPILLAELPRLRAREGGKLAGFRHAAGDAGRTRLLYLDARLEQIAGEHGAAVALLEEIVKLDESPGQGAEPAIRLAESLCALGRTAEAEARSREALLSARDPGHVLLDRWFRIAAVDLGKGPRELLGLLSAMHPAPGEDAGDLAWLLERLARGEPLRIDCGGTDYRAVDGTLWGKDRFFTAGHTVLDIGSGDYYLRNIAVAGSQDPALYLGLRWFEPDDIGASGYRVPLPPGTYEVTLHFAEVLAQESGQRRFGVSLEGKTVIDDYDPSAKSLAAVDARTFRAQVEDGFLDVELTAKTGSPMISAIEVAARTGEGR